MKYDWKSQTIDTFKCFNVKYRYEFFLDLLGHYLFSKASLLIRHHILTLLTRYLDEKFTLELFILHECEYEVFPLYFNFFLLLSSRGDSQASLQSVALDYIFDGHSRYLIPSLEKLLVKKVIL